jgi:hypothetical protein
MAGATLEERLSIVERHVSELATRDDVRALADQILHLGTQMHVGFSALREEIHAGDEETRHVLREEIHSGDEETRRVVREEIRAGDEETRRVLGEEIRAGDEENRRFMRILHEDVVDRLGRLGG